MIPIHQTILADPQRNDGHDADGQPGNCYQAAIASVLDLALEDVPHFATFSDDWVQRSWSWFADRGLTRAFGRSPADSHPLDPHRVIRAGPIRAHPGNDVPWTQRS